MSLTLIVLKQIIFSSIKDMEWESEMIGMEGGITLHRTSMSVLILLVGLLVGTGNPIEAVDQSRGGTIKQPVVDRIVVGLEDYTLVAVSGGRVLFDYTVAIGADTGPTPTGRFSVTSRLKHPWYTPDDEPAERPGSPKNPLGSRWIGISKPSYGLHGTNKPDAIGTKDSEGCVRLRNRHIERLYRHVPEGTPVIIKDNLPLKYSQFRTVERAEDEGAKHSGGG